MKDPYAHITIDTFSMTDLGIVNEHAVFTINMENRSSLDFCLFRGHLVEYLIDNLDINDWHLGNDDRFIQLADKQPVLAVKSAAGRKLIREMFCGHKYIKYEELKLTRSSEKSRSKHRASV